MFNSLVIVFIYLVEMFSLIYATERVERLDKITKIKLEKDLNENEKSIMVFLGIRSIVSIVYIIFLIRFLFIPQFFIYSIITFVLAIISGIILKHLKKKDIATQIWFIKIDAIITMFVWLTPFLEILERVF